MINASTSLLNTPVWRAMLDEARRVAGNAYNPYSGYLVGAAVRTREGEIYAGTFMENASYGLTVCAEVVAVAAANSAGHRDLHSIAVVGGFPDKPDGPACTPCGRCRQVLVEMGRDGDLLVACANLELSKLLLTTASELLPSAWNLPSAMDSPTLGKAT